MKELFPNWLPLQVAEHYGFPVDRYSGKGQSIAVISLGGPVDMKELNRDFEALKVPMPKISEHLVLAKSISSKQEKMNSGETHLDIEILGSICPDAEITVYRGPSNLRGFVGAVNKAVEDQQSIITISWGFTEPTLAETAQMEAALKKAMEGGLTVCVSSGDWGSSNARNSEHIAGPADDGKVHVEYPASSPWVLACGGTELVSKAGQRTEIVWNNSQRGSGAAGGGVSELFPLPHWQVQAGVQIPSASTGNLGRVIPDVAGLAAGGDWTIYEASEKRPTGGSSAVAPLWAGFIALANEARVSAGKARLGFVNERLYQLAARGGLFNDMVIGTNRPEANYPGYDASKGFDACTGWGTAIGEKLFDALVCLD